MTSNFDEIFETLKSFYKVHEATCVVVHDEPERYYLASHEVRAKDGYRTGFGGVEIKKNYVSAHLMPVYIYPELLDLISPELKKRMQGKSCFNFKKSDGMLFEELNALIKKGIGQFKTDGKLKT